MPTDSEASPKIIVPLGQALKDARLAALLSIEDVAKQLNLSVSTARDLEEDLDNVLQTKKYPSIYLRGYLANYAKLVGLTTLALFVEYQQLESAQKEKKTLRASALIIPETKKRTKRLPLILLIVIVVVAVFYLFEKPLLSHFTSLLTSSPELVNKEPANEKHSINVIKKLDFSGDDAVISTAQKTENVVVSSSESAIKTDEILPLVNQPVEMKDIEINDIEIKDVDDEVIEPVAKVVDDKADLNVPTADVENVIIEAANKQTKSEKESVEATFDAFEATDTTEPSEPEIVEETVEEEEDLALSPKSLTLAFTDECWTEIFDASGKRIAFGLYKNGRVLMLSGLAPFQLKLGDPSVVEIQYQDEIIEGNFTPGRSVNFTVPLS